MKRAAFLLLAGLAWVGCGDSREARLHAGTDYIRRRVSDGSPGARMAFGEYVQEGDPEGVVHYLYAEMAKPTGGTSEIPDIYALRPEHPWCLTVLRGPDSSSIVVAAYGESLASPLFSETIPLLAPAH